MTHLAFQTVDLGLAWFAPSFSGVAASGDYFTLTVGGVNNLSITGSGTSTLSFPAGTYLFRVVVGGERSSASQSNTDYIYYQIEVGGSLVGNESGWDRYQNSTNQRISSNVAEAVFTITSVTNVRAKCIAASGSSFTLDSDLSGAMVRGDQS